MTNPNQPARTQRDVTFVDVMAVCLLFPVWMALWLVSGVVRTYCDIFGVIYDERKP